MSSYVLLKYLHVGCVIVSGCLFLGRSAAQLGGIDWRRWRVLRIAPHVIDTILLASAIGLAILLSQYPLQQPWLTAKVLGLVAYILLGFQALRPARSQASRAAFTAAALITFGYVVGVALTRKPDLGIFAY
ncbi:MAG: SirB2 family protein [Xanthomonadales bacterium]|nr:SirB2 family protein [Xanthomonadales bacterium]